MVTFLKVLAYGVGGMAVAGVALLAAFQERLVYVPVLPGLSKSYPFTPARLRLDYEDVWLRAADGVRLHAWFVKHSPERAGPTILFFQENAGNIAHRLEFICIMLQRLHCNVFMLSYRGYGASDGFPSQHGIMKDAQAALDHLLRRTDIDTSRIVVFGRSLGGAVGSVLAKNNPDKVSALILENTFTSILDMAGVALPFLKWFVGGSGSKGPKILNFLVRSPWSTIDIIGKLSSEDQAMKLDASQKNCLRLEQDRLLRFVSCSFMMAVYGSADICARHLWSTRFKVCAYCMARHLTEYT
uniref:Protein bem46 n=1 Tax=Anthurium amnicola TaxID=1678845 RepID=A0A1D1XTA3_9ARAE